MPLLAIFPIYLQRGPKNSKLGVGSGYVAADLGCNEKNLSDTVSYYCYKGQETEGGCE